MMPAFDVVVTGTNENDTLDIGTFPEWSKIQFHGLDGQDTITSSGPFDMIIGGAGDDVITSRGGWVFGDAGNDDITITGSSTTVVFDGAGDDRVNITSDAGTFVKVVADASSGDAENWFSNSSNAYATISFQYFQTSVSISVSVGYGARNLDNGSSTDSFFGFSAVIGSSFDDTFYTESGGHTFFGGQGDDYFWGGTGDDVFFGGSGNDEIIDASGGTVMINAGEGNDRIWVAPTGGSVFAGKGDDVIRVDQSIVTGNEAILFSLGDGDDQSYGSDAFETVRDGSGADVIYLFGKGRIIASGDQTEDSFVGADQQGTIECVSYAHLTNNITVRTIFDGQAPFGDLLTAEVIGSESGEDLCLGIDHFVGGTGDDTFENAGALLAIFTGGMGNDYFDSTLSGARSTTVMRGGAGDDSALGGIGRDIIELGEGKGEITGGTGRDVFCFLTDRSAESGQTQTVIHDFENGVDRIRLGGDMTVEYFIAHCIEHSDGIQFDDGSGDTLELKGLTLDQLGTTDFF